MAITARVVSPVADASRDRRDAAGPPRRCSPPELTWMIPRCATSATRTLVRWRRSQAAGTPFGSHPRGAADARRDLGNAQTVTPATAAPGRGLWLVVAAVACAGSILMARHYRRWGRAWGTGAMGELVLASIGLSPHGTWKCCRGADRRGGPSPSERRAAVTATLRRRKTSGWGGRFPR